MGGLRASEPAFIDVRLTAYAILAGSHVLSGFQLTCPNSRHGCLRFPDNLGTVQPGSSALSSTKKPLEDVGRLGVLARCSNSCEASDPGFHDHDGTDAPFINQPS